MLQRRAQIRRIDDRDKGKDGFKIAQRHFNRMNGRGARRIERRRQPVYLRESRVRVQRKEGLKPFGPVGQGAQHRKRRGRAQTVHPVLRADHMAPAAMGHRQFLAQCSVTIGGRGVVGSDNFETGAERRALIRCKTLDRALANVRQQPVTEPGLERVVLNAQMIDHRVAGKDRIAVGFGRQRHNTVFCGNNAYPGLE